MKRLIIMRHATTPDGPVDHARPLSEQGRQEAARIAKQLLDRGWVPQRIWCSDAVRTTQTCEQLLHVFSSEASFERALYNTSTNNLLEPLRWESTKTFDSVLILSHNPSVSRATQWLTGSSQVALVPAETALLERSNNDWSAEEGAWRLVALLKP